MLATTIVETPIGALLLAVSERGIRSLEFIGGRRISALDARAPAARASDAAGRLLKEAERQLHDYFEGRRRRFELPLDPQGTPFQRRVWQAISRIPFGETASYAQVAVDAGNPNAYRAAGTACGANPVVIVVPCHRVVGSDGGLHGFGGGLPTKTWLLEHEGITLRSPSYQKQLAAV